MPDDIEQELPEGDTFPRDYVEKLRKEAAGYRTALRPFEAAFGDFNDAEKEFLFGMIQALNTDTQEGAKQFRDMAKSIMKDDFYTDLTDIPVPVDENTEQEAPTKEQEGEDQVSLTPEQLKAELDAREKAQQEAAEKAALDAEIEKVYVEIEEAGFERGSKEFQRALSMGAALTAEGEEVNFADLAPLVRTSLGLPEPDPAAAEGGAENEGQPDPEQEGSGKEHAKTAGAGGAGTAAEPAKDWIEQAKAEGRDLKVVARERMEARLSQG